ncbi:hypothetical protein ACIP80_38495 [Streptomyces sp. NPDC088555]|uniref:hypothetical protein n=1 Tax=Streptomyces sp. NPDC088555 TaxID=3365866 RepID=UPI00382D70A3
MVPFGVVFGDRTFDDARSGAGASIGHEVGQDAAADGSGEVDDRAGDDVRSLDDQGAGGVQSNGEADTVGVDVRAGAGGIDRGQAQGLVGGQQCVDLLVNAIRGTGAQDGGLDLQVGGLDLPALVVQGDQFEPFRV